MADSPQAKLPTRRDAHTLLLDAVSTQKGVVVLPPRIVAANGTALEKKNRRMAFRTIQNCGIVPVKFLVDNVNDATALNFHGILAACSAEDDGLGSVQPFGITGDRVSILGVGGNPRVCIYEAYAPEGA